MNNKILLVDANLLLFRSFYAAQALLKNDVGNMPSHFFFNSIFEVIKSLNPTHILFAFDAYGPTKRHQEYDQYKAGRIKAPQELYDQKQAIIEIIESMNMKHFSIVGDEADDIIATVTSKYKNDDLVYIFSEDKDLLQLVDNNVSMLVKNRDKKNPSKYELLTLDNFYSKYNFHPYQVTDYKGIAGDNSDNLIGIKGIGHKSAIDLLEKFSNLKTIYENIDQLKPKQKELFNEYKENAFMCKRLATLNKDVEINFDIHDIELDLSKIKNDKSDQILKKYNLNKIQQIINKL